MKIGLDFDDTIADTSTFKRRFLEEQFGTSLELVSGPKSYIIEHFGKEAYYEAVKAMYEDLDYTLSNLSSRNGSLDTLRNLMMNNDLRIVTARDGQALEVAQTWLSTHRLDIACSGVGYPNSKAEACRGLDVFVDDDLERLKELIGIVPRLFIITTEENKDFLLPDGIIRVEEISEIVKYLEG